MAGGLDFSGMVPGFDFLQNLMKGAGAAMPPMGQWVAPTLDPAELEKRISELRTVQFWLEQNAKLLGTTIQAMEVQRMTLATLQTMNLPMAELRDALTLKPAAASAFTPPPPPSAPTPPPVFAAPYRSPEPPAVPTQEAPAEDAAEPPPPASAASTPPAPPAIDPMKWWGALTQQFTEIASQALQAGTADAAPAAARAGTGAARPTAAAPKPARKPARSPAGQAAGAPKGRATPAAPAKAGTAAAAPRRAAGQPAARKRSR